MPEYQGVRHSVTLHNDLYNVKVLTWGALVVNFRETSTNQPSGF